MFATINNDRHVQQIQVWVYSLSFDAIYTHVLHFTETDLIVLLNFAEQNLYLMQYTQDIYRMYVLH